MKTSRIDAGDTEFRQDITLIWQGEQRAGELRRRDDGVDVAEFMGRYPRWPAPPPKHCNLSWKWYSQNYQPQIIKVLKERGMALFMGPYGTGKTACIWLTILLLLIKNPERSIKFIKWSRLCILVINCSSFTASEEEQERLAIIRRADALFIDDLGGIQPSRVEQLYIYDLLDHRWEHNLLTIASVNVSKEELLERVGGAVLSRFSASIPFTGPDGRK